MGLYYIGYYLLGNSCPYGNLWPNAYLGACFGVEASKRGLLNAYEVFLVIFWSISPVWFSETHPHCGCLALVTTDQKVLAKGF